MARERAVVVGAGGISNAWFRPLVEEKVDIAGVVDLRIDAAKAQIARYALDCEASCDLKATLKKARPDFVVDLTVPEAHCAVTCTALKAGCHVIGEKPMASSMAEARRMVKAAEAAGRLYMVSQSRRWNALHERVRRAVTSGQIGKLTTINCEFYIGAHFGGFRTEMESPLILDMLIHQFDLCRFMTGVEPVAVYCREFNPAGSWYKGDAAATIVFEMTGGVVFTLVGSWCSEGCNTSWNGDWRFLGGKGSLLYEHDREPAGEVVAGKTGFFRKLRAIAAPKANVRYGGMHGALREMLAFLRTGRQPQTECHDNIRSLAMVFAAMESSRKGRRIPVRVL
ncbi:MAG TPA: Gfo/Idh/MocA family oxidoreductase [Phycisphaerae bacterium]|nr:Gfo/Idh/MocA family oxidoreductase [Phycisphaerae bacterium]